ncbi:MAG: rod shape-determining protein MreC [Burkholderiales bacterium]|nr:rod shape-determining protein MreC [Burkholderiales bacterium]
MDRARVMVSEPPVFFNRGPSPMARLVFFSLLSIAAMIADYRFHYLANVRQAVSTIIYPIERVVTSPAAAYQYATNYFISQDRLLNENDELKRRLTEQSAEVQRSRALEGEYAYLQSLVGAPQRLNTKGVVAEVVHVARNPFIRKLVINKGSNEEVRPGLPVIDGTGVVGQVTAVTPFSAEVTLLTDKDQAIPVMVVRNGLRAVTFGTGQGATLSIPFLPINADIRKDDRLISSGIDGTYPPGLTVATVVEVDRSAALAFSRIIAVPTAGVENHRYLMVLTTLPQDDYPNAQLAEPDPKATKGTPGRRARGGRSR